MCSVLCEVLLLWCGKGRDEPVDALECSKVLAEWRFFTHVIVSGAGL